MGLKVFSKIETAGSAEGNEIASGRILFCSFILFFLYPFFRYILPMDDVFWALSVSAGLFICAYKFNLKIMIPLASFFWLALAFLALSAFLLMGPDKTVLPKRMGLFLVSILIMVTRGKNCEWIRPAIMACLTLLTFHAFATIVLNAAPSLYDGFIAPIVHGSSVTVIGPKAGLTSHYSYNGQLVAIGLLISYVLFKTSPLRGGKGTDRLRYGLLTLSFAVALLLTTKRTPLLICILAVILIEYLMASKGKTTTVFKVLLILFIAGVFVVAFGDQIPVLSNVMNRLSAIFTTNTLEESTTGRTLLWDRAIQLWSDSPIFGFGWGTYRYYWTDGFQGVSSAAHNVFLQLLAEVGVVGFIIFMIPALSVFFGLTRSAHRLMREDYDCTHDMCDSIYSAVIFAFVFQLYFFIYCFVGAPLYDFESFPVYFVLSCGVWYSTRSVMARDGLSSHPQIHAQRVAQVADHD